MLYVFREWSFIKDRRTEYFLSLLLALFVSYADTRQFCQEHEHGKHFNIFAPLIITIIFQGTGREKTEMNCYVVYDLTHECCFVRCMLLKITALYLCQVSGKSGGKGGGDLGEWRLGSSGRETVWGKNMWSLQKKPYLNDFNYYHPFICLASAPKGLRRHLLLMAVLTGAITLTCCWKAVCNYCTGNIFWRLKNKRKPK